MSRRKRRSDTMAPALFPFLAVLLCTIGALVMVLAITVTSSHASAKKEAELALLEAKDKSNLVKSQSNELEFRREEMKRDIERRRQALQEIEDHIARLKDELLSLEDGLKKLSDENLSADISLDKKVKRTEELKKEIQQKKKEIEEQIAKKKDRRPAFAIMPYTGRSGTTRRPVYIECVKDKVVIQPEGIVIESKDLIPPGPGNPLATALRVLRNTYSERDAQYGFTQPPYPLLIIRPDGIESYARARAAMSSWDDQFGYELVEAGMDLVFPPGIPGLDKTLADAVSDAKQRQRALVLANPRLAREQELGLDTWDDPVTSNSSISSGFGGDRKTDSTNSANEGNWRMVSPVVGYSGSAQGAAGGQEGGVSGSTMGGRDSAMGSPAGSGTANGNSIAASSGNAGQNVNANVGSMAGGMSDGNSQSGNASNGGVVGGVASGGSTNAASQSPNGANPGSQNSSMGSVSNQTGIASTGSGGTGNDPSNGMPNDFRDQGKSEQSRSVQQSVNQQANAQGGDKSQSPNNKLKHVSSDGDLKPISVGAGRNWAQAKAEGKATPVTRTIKIIALKDKWLVVADSSKLEIEANILHQEKGPQIASEELAKAIRSRVEAWGPSVPGGYWVPTVEIHQASDAQLSVGRMERLLEGSGVELKIVPLQLPRN